ncbi:MAG: 50S ribosomal protein L15 [Anaerolineales bacterium]|jgi:large subunit ribosomal protein L15
MKQHELKAKPGATHRRKRVGRGIAAGQGKTAGRGTKGQGARQGGGPSVYFQGGNLPFFRRLPFKRGFTPLQRVEYSEINLEALEEVPSGFLVTPQSLVGLGLVKDVNKPVVILGRGEVKGALKVQVQRISASARAKLEAAGGTVEIIAPESQEEL